MSSKRFRFLPPSPKQSSEKSQLQVDAMLSRFATAIWGAVAPTYPRCLEASTLSNAGRAGDCVTVQVNDKLHKFSAASLREHSVLFETMLDSTADTTKFIPLGLEVEDACFAAIVPFLHTGSARFRHAGATDPLYALLLLLLLRLDSSSWQVRWTPEW